VRGAPVGWRERLTKKASVAGLTVLFLVGLTCYLIVMQVILPVEPYDPEDP